MEKNKTEQAEKTVTIYTSTWLPTHLPTCVLTYIFIFHIFHKNKAKNLEKPNEPIAALAPNPIYSPWDMISCWWYTLTQAHLLKNKQQKQFLFF